MEYQNYFCKYAASYIRGTAISFGGETSYSRELLEKQLEDLSEEEINKLLELGAEAGIKLYPFKRTHEELPRVKRVVGFLKSLSFESLLDVGSGRGVFLFPFLEQFPWVQVTSVDLLEKRIIFLDNIRKGGVENLKVMQADICGQPLPDNSCDVVTMLEVLEHIPEVEKAIQAAVRIARKHVVVTVPSKEDDNPEHIHLLTKQKLTEMFEAAGCTRLRFDGVNGHLFMVATIEKQLQRS